uniref:pentapeptide repeat-containing protein n=1 Tax=Yoonia sp. TaxID=2212373 RepID=UPI0040475D7F
MATLPDANTNPWYVLMTLYGEQEGEWGDDDLHAKNRAVWNAWSCQGLDDDAAAVVAKLARVDLGETRGWAGMAVSVKRKHRAEMKKRNKDSDFTYPGFPDFEKRINCSGIQFFNTVVLRNCIFTQAADFDSATFTQDADFDSATFTQYAFFNSATFSQDAYFSGATFTQAADFDSATFTQAADFDSATFTQAAFFIRATFTQTATFDCATFTQDAYFYRATFTQAAYFNNATFSQVASFHSANFDGPAKFVAAKFGLRAGEKVCQAYFTEAAFAKVVSFREAEFVSHYPDLEGTQFREGVVLSAKAAFWPVAGKGATDLDESETERAKEACAALRHALGKQGMPEEEHFFFRREMRFAAQIGGLWQRLPYQVFGAVSDFGQSIWRPAVGLLALWAIGALFYTVSYAWGAFDDGQQPREILFGFGLSFANIFKFLGLQRSYFDVAFTQSLNPWLQVMGGVQTVVGFLLLFFLGLGLRTRFRMR